VHTILLEWKTCWEVIIQLEENTIEMDVRTWVVSMRNSSLLGLCEDGEDGWFP